MLESSVKKACLGWLKTLPHSHFWSNPASRYGVAGRPDIEGVWNSYYIGIECKTPEAYKKKDHGLSAAQLAFREKLLKAGGIYTIVDSKETLQELLKALLYESSVKPLEEKS